MLLSWLAPDREAAGARYEDIRHKLIRYFNSRGRPEPERLADETFDRVCEKVGEVAPNYLGDPLRFIYGVAHKILLEDIRKRPDIRIDPVPDSGPEVELRHQCLDECMRSLDSETGTLLLEYYSKDKRARIDHHREMAIRLGIDPDLLRLRMYRARKRLRKCVEECVERNETL